MHPGDHQAAYLVCAMVASLRAQQAYANHAVWKHLPKPGLAGAPEHGLSLDGCEPSLRKGMSHAVVIWFIATGVLPDIEKPNRRRVAMREETDAAYSRRILTATSWKSVSSWLRSLVSLHILFISVRVPRNVLAAVMALTYIFKVSLGFPCLVWLGGVVVSTPNM